MTEFLRTAALNALRGGNYIAVNRTLVRNIGLNCTVVLCELADKAKMLEMDGKTDGEWFYMKVSSLEKNTGLGERAQRTALCELERLGIIEIRYQGMPRRRYIRIDAMKAIEALDDNYSAMASKDVPSNVECRSLETSNDVTIYSETNNKPTEETNTLVREKENEQFEQPSLFQDQPESPARKTKRQILEESIDDIVDYYYETTGRVGSRNNKRLRSHVRARLRDDGYTVDQAKDAIRKKTEDVRGTKYGYMLDPDKLFSPTGFENALNLPDRKGGANGHGHGGGAAADFGKWDFSAYDID